MERHDGRLSGREICSIIKTGNANGARRIVVDGGRITIEFGAEPLASLDPVVYREKAPEPSPEAREELKQLHYDEIIEQIKLSDPARYEQLLADGVIEDIHNEED